MEESREFKMLSFDTKYRYGCRGTKLQRSDFSFLKERAWFMRIKAANRREHAKGNKIRLAREHGGPFGSRVTCETPGNDKNEPYVKSRRAPPPARPTFPRLSFSATWKKVVRWLRPADELRALPDDLGFWSSFSTRIRPCANAPERVAG